MFPPKFIYTLLGLLLVSLPLFSQDNATQNYNLITNTQSVGYGSVNILDPYLSPFEYSGNYIQYLNDSQRYISANDTMFSSRQKILLRLGDAKHPAGINSMQFFGGNYEWGCFRYYRPIKNMKCLLGGSWDFDLGGKYIARNVNNPFSLDLYTDINLAVSADYKFRLKVFKWFSQDFRVEYGMKAPLIGCMFVPPQGESYYEIFSLGNYSDVFHFTSLHNKRELTQYFALDFPVKFATFRAGVMSNLLQYKVNNLVYHNYNLSVNIGCVFNLYVFSGTKNKPSKNFRIAY